MAGNVGALNTRSVGAIQASGITIGVLAGAITSTATVHGTFTGKGKLASAATSTATVSGSLKAKGAIAGLTSGSLITSRLSGDLASLGYSVNDVLTIPPTGPNGRPAKITVNTIGGGGIILSASVTDPGSGIALSNVGGVWIFTPQTFSPTGGTGTGAHWVVSKVSGYSFGPIDTVGTVTGKGKLAGGITSTATVSGRFGSPGVLTGGITSTATVSGTFTAKGKLAGQAAPVASVSGSVKGKGLLAGASHSTAAVAGALGSLHKISGAATSTATVSGFLGAKHAISGASHSTAVVSGDIVGTHSELLAGASFSRATVSGILRNAQYPGPVRSGIFSGTPQGITPVTTFGQPSPIRPESTSGTPGAFKPRDQ